LKNGILALPGGEALRGLLSEIELERGTVLQERGDRIRHAYFPISCVISLLVVMRNGEELDTGVIGREGALGIMCGFGMCRAQTRAVVQVSGKAGRISASALQDAVKDSHTLAEHLLHYGESLTAQVQQTAACNAVHHVEPRLCRWLLQMRDCAGTDLLPLTQDYLATMLGVRRTTVTLTAQALQEAGLIRYRRGQIEILDAKGLHEISCECYDVMKALAPNRAR
jgi:CRP-like cAMP-binding protein